MAKTTTAVTLNDLQRMIATEVSIEAHVIAMACDPVLTGAVEKASMLMLSAKQVTVTDQVSCDRANDILNEAKSGQAAVESAMKGHAEFGNRVHKSFTGYRGYLTDQFEDVQNAVAPKITTWLRKQREAAERAQQEAARLQRQTELELQRKAREAMEEGRVRDAKDLQAAATIVPTMPIPQAAPIQMQGTTVRSKWVGSVDEGGLMKIIQAIATGKIPLYYLYRGEQRPILEVVEAVLAGQVSMHGQSLNIPGVSVYEDTILARSGGR